MLKFIIAMLLGAGALLGGLLVGVLIANGRYNQPLYPDLVNPSPSPSFTLHIGEDQ